MLRNIFASLLFVLLKKYFLEATTSLTQGVAFAQAASTMFAAMDPMLRHRPVHRKMPRQDAYPERPFVAADFPRLASMQNMLAEKRLESVSNAKSVGLGAPNVAGWKLCESGCSQLVVGLGAQSACVQSRALAQRVQSLHTEAGALAQSVAF